ncbi:MAG: hypothetical protein ABH869_07530 [Candidatus Omnitrophota bacterium]
MGRYFAVLDAGCQGINAVAAQWGKDSDYTIEGFCRGASKGFRKGRAIDVSMAVDSISGVLDILKGKTGKRIQDIYMGVTSVSIEVTPSSGILVLSKYGREVTLKDIARCKRIASTIKLPINREVLHGTVKGFYLDGEVNIKWPVNLEGVKLGVDMNVITVSSSVLSNLSKCISLAGYVPAGFIFSGFASACRVLDFEDKEEGTALIDISSDMTEILIFSEGLLADCKVFSSGTQDFCLKNDGINGNLIEELCSRITGLPYWQKVNKISLIGEGSLKDSLIETLEERFNIPISTGVCKVRPSEDLPADRMGYIGSLGVLDYLTEERRTTQTDRSIIPRGINAVMGFIDKYF